jgi:tRNA threonylcarbamoyladenosine biosynthesis protein TsaE
VLMKTYPIVGDEHFTALTHIDAYRVESTDELRVIRFDEIVADPKRLVVIEWPERIGESMPPTALRVSITLGEGGERSITYGD